MIFLEIKFKFKKYRLKLLLLFLSLFFAFLIVETFLRLTEDVVSDYSECSSLDKDFHHIMVPNSICNHQSDEWNVEFEINNLGIRDESLTFSKIQDEYRILLLGDSFTQGHGLQLEERYSNLLEKKLNEKNSSKKIKIINAAVFAHSPLVQYLYLKKVGIFFRPDLVMYAFTITDFFDDNKRFQELAFSYPETGEDELLQKIRDGTVEFDFENISRTAANEKNQKMDKSKTIFLAKKWLRENIKSYKLIVDLIKNRKEINNQLNNQYTGDINHDIYSIVRGEQISDDNWNNLFKLPIFNLNNMKALLAAKNIPFIVIAIPDAIQVSPDEWPGRTLISIDQNFTDTREPFQIELKDRLSDLGIPTINLLPGFIQSDQFPLYFRQEYHWNKNGHQLAAELIYTYLNQSKYLKE